VKNREAKKEAMRMARNLLELAVRTASTDLELAKKQAMLARRIMLKFNIRFDWSLRKFYCHGCKQLILPGINATIRLGHKVKMIRLTCNQCGFINRKVLANSRHA
jgi:ribonuclease P protein subunit RPR2